MTAATDLIYFTPVLLFIFLWVMTSWRAKRNTEAMLRMNHEIIQVNREMAARLGRIEELMAK